MERLCDLHFPRGGGTARHTGSIRYGQEAGRGEGVPRPEPLSGSDGKGLKAGKGLGQVSLHSCWALGCMGGRWRLARWTEGSGGTGLARGS